MHYSNYLAQIAALIKQDPSITVREIATELKFADSKSVYYWLEKGKVGGINEFKRMVLSEERPHPSSVALDIDGTQHYLVLLPLFDWNPKQKNPVQEWYHLHDHPQPRGLFAIRVSTTQYSPWFIQNDILVISEGSSCPEGSWALVKTQREFCIGRVINKQIVDPNTLEAYAPSLTRVGTIVSQQRYFSV